VKEAVFWDMTPCGSERRTDVSEEHTACIFRVIRLWMCRYKVLSPSSIMRYILAASWEGSEPCYLEDGGDMFLRKSVVLIGVTRCHIPEDNILNYVGFEVFTAVTMKDVVFLGVTVWFL
jgi:hypothetical protein